MATTEKAYFCGHCGSPSLDMPVLSEEACCRTCGWRGPKSDLSVSQFSHESGSSEEVSQTLARDIRNLLAKELAPAFALFLRKWGFLPTDERAATASLVGYLNAVSRAFWEAIVKERERQEKESRRVQ